MFLRFLGVLIYMRLDPLPNIEMHWRTPSHWPDNLHVEEGKVKSKMREIIFMKYWRYMTLPGVIWGDDNTADEEAESTTSTVY